MLYVCVENTVLFSVRFRNRSNSLNNLKFSFKYTQVINNMQGNRVIQNSNKRKQRKVISSANVSN